MPNKNFNNFDAKTTLTKNDQFVGFSSTSANGEKRWTYENLKTSLAPALPFRNILINGDFGIWQRAPQGSKNIQNFRYVTDRWVSGISADWNIAGSVEVAPKISDFPIIPFTYDGQPLWTGTNTALKYTYNVTSLGDKPLEQQLKYADGGLAIQSYENVAAYLGRTLTLSFFARASSPCKLLHETQIHSTEGSMWTPTINKLFDLTTSWQRFTYTYTMPTYDQVRNAAYDPSTVDASNPRYVALSTQNKLPSVASWVGQADFKTFWSKGSCIRHGNSSARPAGYPGQAMTDAELKQLADSAESMKRGGWIEIANVQLEEGDVATPFEIRPRGVELELCQRYCEKSYPLNVAPGTVNGGTYTYHTYGNKNPSNTYDYRFMIQFATPKRARPTVTCYTPNSGALKKFLLGNPGHTALFEVQCDLASSSHNGFHTSGINRPEYLNGYVEWIAECEI